MMDAAAIRQWLMTWEFWALEALFLAFVVTTALAIPSLVRALGLSRRWYLGLGAIAAGSLVLVYLLPPVTSRIYYDEQIYQDVGQNMADLHRTQMCDHGIAEYGQLQCLSAEYNKEPDGYPYLLSAGYRVFGVSDGLAHHLNRLLQVLLTIVVALTAVRWFGDARAGLLAALFMNLLPEQLRWSATAAAEPSAAFFVLVAVLAAVEFSRTRKNRSLAWLVAATAWAVQFRPEAVFVIGLAALIVAVQAPGELRRPRLWVASLAGALMLATYGLHVLAVRHESWGTPGPTFSTMFLGNNLSVNGWFYVWDHRWPVWMLPLALAGLLIPAGSRRARLLAAGYGVAFWGVFLFFYAGSYDYGADVRYSLMSAPPIVMLAALGGSWLLTRLGSAARQRRAALVALAAMAWMFLWQVPYVRAVGEEGWGARADVAFAREVSPTLPPDALVLTQDPNMFLLWGVDAAQLSLAGDPSFLENARRRHGDHVFLHWGFWCNVADPEQTRLCSDLLGRTPATLVREQHVRDYRFAFYRLDR